MNKVTAWDLPTQIGLIFLLVFTPLAFGAVHEWAYSLGELVLFLVLFLVCLRKVLHPDHQFSFNYRFLIPPLVLFLFLISLQIIPITPGALKFLSKGTYELYKIAIPAYDGPVGQGVTETLLRPLSLNPGATLVELMKLLAYLGVFLLILKQFRTNKEINRLALVIIVVASFEAFYGLAEYLSGRQNIFLFKKIYYVHAATGTYINKNHFAGYLEMAFPLVLGLLYSYYREGQKKLGTVRKRLVALGEKPYLLLLYLAGIIMALGIFFSLSKGGWGGFFFSLLVFLAILLLRGEGFSLAVVGLVLFSLLGLLWAGLGPVLEGASTLAEPGHITWEGRQDFWASTTQLIKDFPVFGTGLGTFRYIFPRYQSRQYSDLYVDYAHNDYLESVADMGLAGGLLLLWGLVGWFWYVTPSLSRKTPVVNLPLAIGSLASVVAILVHSLFDFNLRIPANAMLFSAIAALGLVASRPRGAGSQANSVLPKMSHWPGRKLVRVIAAGGVLLFLALSSIALREFIGGIYGQRAEVRRTSSASSPGARAPIQEATIQTIKNYEQAIKWSRSNEEYHVRLANLYATAWVQERSSALLDRLTFHIDRAVKLNPISDYNHFLQGWKSGILARSLEGSQREDLLTQMKRQFDIVQRLNTSHYQISEAIYLFYLQYLGDFQASLPAFKSFLKFAPTYYGWHPENRAKLARGLKAYLERDRARFIDIFVRQEKLLSDRGWFPEDKDIFPWFRAYKIDFQIANNRIKIRTLKEGAHMVSFPGLLIDSEQRRFFELKMKSDRGSTLKLYWATLDSIHFNNEKLVKIPLVSDGQFHLYRVDLGSVKGWKGTVFQLLLDPVDTPAQVEIDYFRFL